jgi:hypothetical protein
MGTDKEEIGTADFKSQFPNPRENSIAKSKNIGQFIGVLHFATWDLNL